VRFDNLTKRADYGPASFDRRHVFAANYVITMPNLTAGNAFVHALTNGWQYSGVVTANTGSPFTPGFSISGVGSNNLTGNTLASGSSEGARIGYVYGCNPYTNSQNPFNRLNPACFTAPRPGSLGLESGLNWLYNPGLIQFDMSLQKQFSVKERLRFQFRVDAFNIFNHPNFTGLNTTVNFAGTFPNAEAVSNAPYNASGQLVNTNGFGTVNATGIPRILQTVIRIQF
jgi:hypothetical protein